MGPTLGFLSAVHLDGSDYRVLSEGWSLSESAPSPDGRTLAYDQGGTAWLFHWDTVHEPFDPAAYGLPVQALGSPAWSPDGRQLAWIASVHLGETRQMSIAIFDLLASTFRLVSPSFAWQASHWPPALCWSPDGRWLAFDGLPAAGTLGQALWVYAAGGGEAHLLGVGSLPRWSPDGQWLSFSGESGPMLARVGTWRPHPIPHPIAAISPVK